MSSRNERPINARSLRGAPSVSLSLILLLGAGAVGCSDNAAEELSTTEAPALFTDPHTSGPRLDVYEFDGRAAISVSGPIGSEANALNAGETLVEIYSALHPNSAVPDALVELDARIAQDLAALPSTPHAAPEASLPAPVIEKSESSFRSTVCKPFGDQSVRYDPQTCEYRFSHFIYSPDPGAAVPRIASGDRTYAWNESSSEARLSWHHNNGMVPQVVASTTLPAYWWRWMSFTGAGAPFWAVLQSNPGADGAKGITWHKRTVIVR
jgi:hypothetical protein